MRALQLLVASILLFALIGFLAAYLFRFVSESKNSQRRIAEVRAPAKPVDPDEDSPGTYGGPYNRHPKYPPRGDS
jgi:hypothetical protein